jgi:hypothetical protein
MGFFGRLHGRSERELKQLDTNFRRLKELFFCSLGYLYRLVVDPFSAEEKDVKCPTQYLAAMQKEYRSAGILPNGQEYLPSTHPKSLCCRCPNWLVEFVFVDFSLNPYSELSNVVDLNCSVAPCKFHLCPTALILLL